MRKKLFGAFVALTVAGAATAQTPFPPYGGQAGSPYTNQPIPAMIPGGPNGAMVPQLNPGPGMIPPGADPSQMLPPNHQPVYPPPGPYGQTMYESPYPGGAGAGSGYGGGGAPGPVAPRVWFKGDYLLMFLKGQPSRTPLISTGLSDPGVGQNGVLGQSSTIVLFGGDDFRFNPGSGFRLEGGFWGDDDQRVGASISSFYIPPTSQAFFSQSGTNGGLALGRPFFNINPNATTINGVAGPSGDIAPITQPGAASGNVIGKATTRFWGIDANAIVNLYRGDPANGYGWSLNFLAGYRYMELQESILVQSNALLGADNTFNNVTILAGSNVAVRDYFATGNRFNGGQVGLESQANSGRWLFSAYGKVGFGVTSQRIQIEGTTSDGGANNFVGGVFANSTNIGTYTYSDFAITTDVNATIGYSFTPRLTGTIGYNFVFLGAVARPGDAINGNIDPVNSPGNPNIGTTTQGGTGGGFIRPTRDDFYMHGLNFGFNLTF